MNNYKYSIKKLLDTIRSADRKLYWIEGYITSHSPDTILLRSLEQSSQDLKNLELQLLRIVEDEDENGRDDDGDEKNN